MSERIPRIEVHKGVADNEWPPEIREKFIYLTEQAHHFDFSLLCGVGLNHKERRLSAFFGPHTSDNPHLAEMCDDIAEMFTLMAKRLRQ